ncbi:MAG: cytochrome P450, partial [Hyphomicrobiales bacterium]
WRPKSIVLEVDPPLHDRTRGVMARILSPQAMRKIRPHFEARAARLADALVERRRFDAIPDLAEAYPLMVFPDAMGLQQEGRENLLLFSTMVFNSFGPQNKIYKASLTAAEPALEWILAQCSRDRLAPDGFGAQVFDHMDAGDLTEEEAPIIVRSLLTAGLDTTVNGLGSALYAFAGNPDQWRALREDPSLIKPAFDEVLRWESPVQTFFRTASRDVEVDGAAIPKDAKVLLFLGAANRDPRKWPAPESFDIARRPVGHVAFGTGIHRCVGQLLARLEADVMLAALIERVERFELTGPPVRKLNNTLRALESLPVEAVPI